MSNLLLITFAASIFSGCYIPSKNKASDQISYREKSEELERCVGDACAQIVLSYPSFEGDQLLAEQLNAGISRQLIHFMQIEEQESHSLKGAVQDFFAAYIKFREEFAEPVQEWTLELTGEVTYQTENLLGLRFSSYSYLGGAHPNAQELHLTFDLEKGGTILLQKDMVLNEDKLLELALEEFRDIHRLKPAVSLEENGRFFLNEGKFFLPRSMGYEQDEFVLLYNSYEIGSYVMGSTELRFPLNQLEGIVLLK
ncbi:MAG: DUF3298 and DUF4163 domain-containing protein [Anditalea sp.]